MSLKREREREEEEREQETLITGSLKKAGQLSSRVPSSLSVKYLQRKCANVGREREKKKTLFIDAPLSRTHIPSKSN